MDTTLERILSLIPQKADGRYVHGAKKEFAASIGLKSGNVIADWVSGKSKSYNDYVYEIAAKYGVSVAWLKGETNIKEKPTAVTGSELKDELGEYLEMLRTRPECRALLKTVKDATKAEVEANVKFIEALRGYGND